MISVVMPAYNSEAYVGQAIDSILNQTYPDFELLVVDDGSTDGTRAVAEQYAARDSRVRVILGDHQGSSAARNKGIAEARFPWIAVMDADDISLPERLEKEMAAAQADPEVVVWGTAARHVGPDLRRLSAFSMGPTSKAQFDDMRRRAVNVQVCHSSALYRREVALRVGGYNVAFKAACDTEFFDRLANEGYFITLPERLILYREHSDSITLQRYHDQKLHSRYVSDRQRRRVAGEPPISLDQFAQQYWGAPLMTRYRRWRRDTGDVTYVRARIAFGQKHYLAALGDVGLALLINPLYFIPQIGRSIDAYAQARRAQPAVAASTR